MPRFGHDELRAGRPGRACPVRRKNSRLKKQFVRQTAVCIGNEVVREFRRSGVPVEHEEVEQGHEDHARRIVGPEFVAVCLQQFRYGCEGIGRPVEEVPTSVSAIPRTTGDAMLSACRGSTSRRVK